MTINVTEYLCNLSAPTMLKTKIKKPNFFENSKSSSVTGYKYVKGSRARTWPRGPSARKNKHFRKPRLLYANSADQPALMEYSLRNYYYSGGYEKRQVLYRKTKMKKKKK